MPLSVVSRKNTLNTIQNEYVIRSNNSGVITTDLLIEKMAADNTTLTAADIAACLKVMTEVISEQLEDGKKVITPFCSFYVTAAGKADSDMEEFTPGKGENNHRFTLHLLRNSDFENEIVEKTLWKRDEVFDKTVPLITEIDTVAGDGTYTASKGDMLRITGRRLSFTFLDEGQGIFFCGTDENIGKETRAAVYAEKGATLIIARVPDDLAAGSYTIKIVTQPQEKGYKKAFVFPEVYTIS